MNKKQQLVLLFVAVVVFVMLLFPPFHIMGRGMGYAWLFARPHEIATINAAQLIAQWLGVLIVGGIAFLLLKNNNERLFSAQSKKAVPLLVEDKQGSKKGSGRLKSPKDYARMLAIGAAIFGFLVGMSAGIRSMRDTDHSLVGGAVFGVIIGLPTAFVFWLVTYIVVLMLTKIWFFLFNLPPSKTK